LDRVLVERGHAPDLDAARELVRSGRVLVDGAPALSPARAVAADERVVLVEARRFVGRGGVKLDAALDRFAVDVHGALALDIGASTGGFTDCLLQRGAARVLAVDVGHGQLHERLLDNARVVSLERTNLRDLQAPVAEAALGGRPGVVTMDMSFTSVVPHARAAIGLAAPGAPLLILVKPQFEVDHVTASRGRGVVTDAASWRSVLAKCASAIEDAGAGIMGAMPSPILGTSGNVEFFLHARAAGSSVGDLDAVLDAAVAEAERP